MESSSKSFCLPLAVSATECKLAYNSFERTRACRGAGPALYNVYQKHPLWYTQRERELVLGEIYVHFWLAYHLIALLYKYRVPTQSVVRKGERGKENVWITFFFVERINQPDSGFEREVVNNHSFQKSIYRFDTPAEITRIMEKQIQFIIHFHVQSAVGVGFAKCPSGEILAKRFLLFWWTVLRE